MILVDKNKILNRKETIRYLGYQNTMPDEMMLREIEECEKLFLEAVDPKFHFEVFDIKRIENQLMTADSQFIIPGNAIYRHLEGCDKAAFACATLSGQVDALIDEVSSKDMLHALLLDAIANAAVEEVRAAVEQEVKNQYPDDMISWLFGIGYGDLPLSLQPKFLERIHAEKKLGVTANSRCILEPLKSISGFIGISSTGQNSHITCRQRGCAVCSRQKDCQFARK